MKYGHSFLLYKQLNVDVYCMEFVNDVPTRFQIFINGNLEVFMYYDDEWQVDKYGFATGALNEDVVQQIGNYIMALHE